MFAEVKDAREAQSLAEFAEREYHGTRERLAVRYEIAASRVKSRGEL